jgi:hypothetical protein
MIKINKEQADNIVLSILSEISKFEDKDFAEQSLNLMNNNFDNAILTGIILNKATPSIFTQEEIKLHEDLVQIIGSYFYNAKEYEDNLLEDGFSANLVEFMEKEDISEISYNESIRMKFAINQFVNAFLEYGRLEKQYPAVMKFM